MLGAFDYETEYARVKDFKNLAPYLKNVSRETFVLNPICLTYFNGKTELVVQTFSQLMEAIRKQYPKGKQRFKIVAHNAFGYELEIMLYELLTYDYKQVFLQSNTLEYKFDEEIIDKNMFKDRNFLKHKEFTLSGDSLKSTTMFTVQYYNIEFTVVDSLKVFIGSLKKMCEIFGIEQKGEYNFDNHVVGTNHKEIIKYGIQDSKCLYYAYVKLLELLDSDKHTSASIALEKIKQEVDWVGNYPKLDKYYTDITKLTYHGGIVFINDNILERENGRTIVSDRKSSYPAEVVLNPLPYGEPYKDYNIRKSTDVYQDIICHMTYKCDDDKIPFFRFYKHRQIAIRYNEPTETIIKGRKDIVREFKGIIAINNIDLETLQKTGQVTINSIHTIISYELNMTLSNYFHDNFMKKENSSDKAEKESYKLAINSPTGKFIQDLTGSCNVYILKHQKSSNSMILAANKIQVIDNNSIYPPLTSAIIAGGRRAWVDYVNCLKIQDVYYGDTDSVHFRYSNNNKKKIKKYLGEKLGEWDINIYDNSKYIGLKTYCLHKKNECDILECNKCDLSKRKCQFEFKCIGIPKRYLENCTIDEFYLGRTFKVLKAKRITGGNHLKQMEVQIRR